MIGGSQMKPRYEKLDKYASIGNFSHRDGDPQFSTFEVSREQQEQSRS